MTTHGGGAYSSPLAQEQKEGAQLRVIVSPPDTVLTSTQRMKLPNVDKARVERKKIVEYLLSASHPDGGAKARFFSSFGFNAEKWTIFAAALKEQARTHDVSSSIESHYGTRYTVDGRLTTPDGRNPNVRTVWVMGKRGKSPRLITAFPI
jgi:uncharacterized protein DUF6883